MVGLVLAALIGHSKGGQAPKITFACRAEPLGRIIKELGAAAHMDLTVAPVCANDVLVISATDVPVRDLLDEIARVDAAAWEPSGDGYALGADEIARRTEAQHEKAHQGNLLHAAILKQLADAQKAAAGRKPTDADNMQMASPFGLGGNGPGQIAVLSLLKSIDPPSLVVDETHRAVFSSNPNSMQLPLGGGADEIIQELIEKHNSAIPKDATKTEADIPPALEAIGSIKSMIEQATTPIAGYFKADLVVAPMPYLGGTTATLILYDNKGKVLLTALASIQSGLLEAILQMQKPAAAASSSTPIELSPETKAFLDLSGGGIANPGAAQQALSRKIPPTLKPFLTDPLQHDPLSLLPTDELLALSKSAKKPLVAVVPDNAISLGSFLLATKPTIEEFVHDLDTGKTMVMSEQNGWIEIKPVAPESARENRTDRGALAKLLKASLEKHIPSLDDIAEFAQNAPSPMTGGVTQMYLSLFVPGAVGGGMEGITNWDMYRIYGQISPDRRQALISGGRVSLDSLTPAQQGYLNEMVYGPMAQLQVGDASNPTDVISTMMSMFMGGGADYKAESTELLPSGIPSGGEFQMTADEEPVLVPVAPAGQGDSIPTMVGMDEMAMVKYFSQQPMFAQAASMIPKFGQMRVGHRVAYHLTFSLTRDIRLTGTLRDNSLPDDAETVDANNLPQDMQDKISKETEALKKSVLGALASLGGLGGAGVKPP